jgi:hypothetical protein
MRPVTLFRSPATALLAVSLALAACTSATPSASPVSPPASDSPAAPDQPPTPVPSGATPAPLPTPGPVGREPSVPSGSYTDMPISLEMTVGCGMCGAEYWMHEAPVFRLYADGLAVYRPASDNRATAPYRFVKLDDPDLEELIRYALDEGGLQGAESFYRGDADDAPTTTFVLHASWIDEGADVDVQIEPVLGEGTTDASGNPITDLPRREQLAGLEDLLSNFDDWIAKRGLAGTPFEPEGYVAAIGDAFPGTGGNPWPEGLPSPDTFAPGSGLALARMTSEQAEQARSAPGGGFLRELNLGDGRIGTLLIRPILPGDDRPGAFGIRPDTVAITVEPDLRVRSRPEVSDESVKYEPLLERGDALYVLDGPVEGSSYSWYNVYAPRTGLAGWVAAAAKTGEDWIAPVSLPCTLGASPFEIVDKIGYDLMHLACYSGVEFSGTYRLAPYKEPPEFELTCPDEEYIAEPGWLNMPLFCPYNFGPEQPDTGGYDLPAGGVLHPSLADVPAALLESSPEGLRVTATGQLDHPDTRGCTSHGSDQAWEVMVQLRCRTTFVITELRAAD